MGQFVSVGTTRGASLRGQPSPTALSFASPLSKSLPPPAARTRQHVEPTRPFEKLRPRTVGASPRALGHVRRGFWSHRGLRRETGPNLTRRRKHARPNGMTCFVIPEGGQARCGYRRRETAEERQRIPVHRHRAVREGLLERDPDESVRACKQSKATSREQHPGRHIAPLRALCWAAPLPPVWHNVSHPLGGVNRRELRSV